MSELKKGAFLSYISIILTNLIGLILTPFIIKSLGDSEFGLYVLIGSLISYLSLMDLGLNNTIIRFIAKYRAKNDKKGEENFLAIIFLIYFFISIILIFIGLIIFFNLDNIFSKSLTLSELKKAKIMFTILIFNIAITLPGGSFVAISTGYEKFIVPKTLTIVKYIIRSLTILILLLMGGKAIGIVLLDTVINILFISFNAFYVLKYIKVTIKFHQFNRNLIKEVLKYSIWIFLFAIFNQFQWQSGQFVLGILKDTKTVAVFAIGIMLGTYYGAFSSAISSLLLPKTTKMVYNSSTNNDLNVMFIKVGRILLFILLLIFGGFILYGQQFIFLWLGEGYQNAWLISLLIMSIITIPLTQGFAHSILEARNELKTKVITAITSMIFGITLGAYLVQFYEILGMIIGILIGRLIYEIILNIYFTKIIELDVFSFFKYVYTKTLIIFLVILFFGIIINKINDKGWIVFLIKLVLYVIEYCILMYNFALNNEEKLMIKNILVKKNDNKD